MRRAYIGFLFKELQRYFNLPSFMDFLCSTLDSDCVEVFYVPRLVYHIFAVYNDCWVFDVVQH